MAQTPLNRSMTKRNTNMSRLTEHLLSDVGSPDTGAKSPISGLLLEGDRRRFWAKVCRRKADECWPWTASLISDGYGQFSVMSAGGASRKQLHLYAHRVAWIVTHGDIPAGMSVLHRCDNARCCNPAHLFLGTHTDNMRDAASKGRLSVPRPRRQKVTSEQLAEIDQLLAAGTAQARIAERFGASKGWVSSYAKGERRQYDRPARRKAVA